MKSILLIFCTFNVFNIKAQIISDKEYEKLPPLFLMYSQPESCWANPNYDYCLIEVDLLPENDLKPSETWQTIELIMKHYEYFERNKIKVTACLNILNNEHNTSEYLLKEYVKPHLTGKGISASVRRVTCELSVRDTTFTIYDVISIVLLSLFFYLLAKATFSDQTTLNKYLRPFSLKNNIGKLIKMWKESNRMKAIESLRFFTITLIILLHSLLSFYSSFIQNTKYLEDMCFNKRMMFVMFNYLVTIFFLLSGWMLSYNSMQILSTTSNQMSFWKFFSLQAINRYCRLIPHIIFSILLSISSLLLHILPGPVIHADSRNFMQDCKENWWTTILFIQNHYLNVSKMCLPLCWYVSADFQLYLISLIILYVVWRWKLSKTIVFIFLIAMGLLFNSYLIWQYELPMIFGNCGRNMRRENLDKMSFSSSVLYLSTYANFLSYMVGLAYGYCLFYQKEEQPIKNNIVKNALIANFVISPFLIVYFMSLNDQIPKMFVPIIGALNKPLMAFAVGGGIFAMLKGHGGWLKKIFEYKLFVFLANFSYAIYMFHQLVVFERLINFQKPFEVNGEVLTIAFIKDWISSIILGIFMFLIIELPFSQLQSLLIPKLSKNLNKSQ